jgi:all-trans-retinol dehydrogenase (NAD+)
MIDLAHKKVLITGGASGIGRLLAQELARASCQIVLWDINQEALDATVKMVRDQFKVDARGYFCDVGNRENVDAVASRVLSDVGAIDILINNAGVVSGNSFLEIEPAKIEKTFAVNTLALFWVTRAFLPAMLKAQSGHIVTIASAAGWIGVKRLVDYSASKWAAVGFDEALRMELRQVAPSIKTLVVCPFFINTGMFDGVKTRFSWLLPILDERVVVKKIVRAIKKNRRRILMPWIVYFVPLLRMLPVGLFDWVADFLGINSTMDQFVGRAGGHNESSRQTGAKP